MNEAERNGSCWQMDLGEQEDEEEAAVMAMVVAKAGELRRRQRASTQTLLAISSEWDLARLLIRSTVEAFFYRHTPENQKHVRKALEYDLSFFIDSKHIS